MNVTKNIRKYVNEMGFNLAELARKAKMPYMTLYASLSENGERELKADELIAICRALKINPFDFCDEPEKTA